MSSAIRKWPSRLKEMLDVVQARMQREGFSVERASTLAEAAVSEIAQLFGGNQIYLPHGAAMKRAIRDVNIFKEFTGGNVDELSKKYGVSTVCIYEVIKKQREELKIE